MSHQQQQLPPAVQRAVKKIEQDNTLRLVWLNGESDSFKSLTLETIYKNFIRGCSNVPTQPMYPRSNFAIHRFYRPQSQIIFIDNKFQMNPVPNTIKFSGKNFKVTIASLLHRLTGSYQTPRDSDELFTRIAMLEDEHTTATMKRSTKQDQKRTFSPRERIRQIHTILITNVFTCIDFKQLTVLDVLGRWAWERSAVPFGGIRVIMEGDAKSLLLRDNISIHRAPCFTHVQRFTLSGSHKKTEWEQTVLKPLRLCNDASDRKIIEILDVKNNIADSDLYSCPMNICITNSTAEQSALNVSKFDEMLEILYASSNNTTADNVEVQDYDVKAFHNSGAVVSKVELARLLVDNTRDLPPERLFLRVGMPVMHTEYQREGNVGIGVVRSFKDVDGKLYPIVQWADANATQMMVGRIIKELYLKGKGSKKLSVSYMPLRPAYAVCMDQLVGFKFKFDKEWNKHWVINVRPRIVKSRNDLYFILSRIESRSQLYVSESMFTSISDWDENHPEFGEEEEEKEEIVESKESEKEEVERELSDEVLAEVVGEEKKDEDEGEQEADLGVKTAETEVPSADVVADAPQADVDGDVSAPEESNENAVTQEEEAVPSTESASTVKKRRLRRQVQVEDEELTESVTVETSEPVTEASEPVSEPVPSESHPEPVSNAMVDEEPVQRPVEPEEEEEPEYKVEEPPEDPPARTIPEIIASLTSPITSENISILFTDEILLEILRVMTRNKDPNVYTFGILLTELSESLRIPKEVLSTLRARLKELLKVVM